MKTPVGSPEPKYKVGTGAHNLSTGDKDTGETLPQKVRWKATELDTQQLLLTPCVHIYHTHTEVEGIVDVCLDILIASFLPTRFLFYGVFTGRHQT